MNGSRGRRHVLLTRAPIGVPALPPPAAAAPTEGAPRRRAAFIGPPASSIPGIVKRLTSPFDKQGCQEWQLFFLAKNFPSSQGKKKNCHDFFPFSQSYTFSIRIPLPLHLYLALSSSSNLLLAGGQETSDVSKNRRRGWGW